MRLMKYIKEREGAMLAWSEAVSRWWGSDLHVGLVGRPWHMEEGVKSERRRPPLVSSWTKQKVIEKEDVELEMEMEMV